MCFIGEATLTKNFRFWIFYTDSLWKTNPEAWVARTSVFWQNYQSIIGSNNNQHRSLWSICRTPKYAIHYKRSMCILDRTQSTSFCLGKFLKKRFLYHALSRVMWHIMRAPFLQWGLWIGPCIYVSKVSGMVALVLVAV